LRAATATLLALATAGVAPARAEVPAFESVRAAHRPSDVELLDRHGQPLQVVRVDPRVRRGPWVRLDELSPAMRHAIVLGEDRRFWDHGGVDWAALAAGAWASAWNERTRGASTLTMQLAGLIDERVARPAGGRSAGAKLGQIAAAREIESRWRKTEILEAYLNLVPLRGELVGVPAAAQALFGKHPGGLDTHEAAVLAAMVRGPNAAAAPLARRACALLQAQRLACEGVETLAAQALARRPGPAAGEQLAPHFARQALRWRPATGPWRSTLDARVQRAAIAALRQQLAELRGREVEDGAVVVLDNASGEVLAWVGSSGGFSQAAEVDAVLARRQPGSTLKPFVYARALARGLIAPDSLLHDAPLQVEAGAGTWRPRNYDPHYSGWVPARVALAASLNVPAVQLATALGVDDLFTTLGGLGLGLRESGGFHGPSLALGSAEVTLLDLANAYRALANGGRWSALRMHPAAPATAPREVLESHAARAVVAMLADATARAPTFGFDSPLALRVDAAVKTGTSKDLRDNWCVGFTARHTVAVWVGNASGRPMHAVSGVAGAAPAWQQVVEALVRLHGAPGALPALPAPQDAAALAAPAFGISTPAPGSVWVLDPSIPWARQRIALEGAGDEWWLGSTRVGQGRSILWAPRPGRHRLELRRRDGVVVDRVEFEVRAMPPPRRPSPRPVSPRAG
jgi:penicillin-binding protein 1C